MIIPDIISIEKINGRTTGEQKSSLELSAQVSWTINQAHIFYLLLCWLRAFKIARPDSSQNFIDTVNTIDSFDSFVYANKLFQS